MFLWNKSSLMLITVEYLLSNRASIKRSCCIWWLQYIILVVHPPLLHFLLCWKTKDDGIVKCSCANCVWLNQCSLNRTFYISFRKPHEFLYSHYSPTHTSLNHKPLGYCYFYYYEAHLLTACSNGINEHVIPTAGVTS